MSDNGYHLTSDGVYAFEFVAWKTKRQAAQKTGQHGARRRQFPACNHQPCALGRSHRSIDRAGRQRLLLPPHGRGMPR